MTRRRAIAALAVAAAVLPAGAGFSGAAFTAGSANAGNTVSAHPDWAAPAVARAVVMRVGAAVPGSLAPGASYHVYAGVQDGGNPASGTAAVEADLTAISAATGSAPMTSGAWTVAGESFNFRAGPFVADAALAPGPAAFSITTGDQAGNTASTGFSATIDASAPLASDVQAQNASATASRLEAGDSLTLTFSEPVDPASLVASWDGTAPTPAVVRLNRGTGGGNDNLTFFAPGNVTQLPLGTVDLGRGDYTGGNLTFGATGTASTIAHARVVVGGDTVSRFTIVLGTQSAAPKTAKGAGTMTWRPAGALMDPAGNTIATTPAAETGTLDADF